MKDAAVDLVISIFAPRNFPEAARVLRRGGWIAVAYPGGIAKTSDNNVMGMLYPALARGSYASIAPKWVAQIPQPPTPASRQIQIARVRPRDALAR